MHIRNCILFAYRPRRNLKLEPSKRFTVLPVKMPYIIILCIVNASLASKYCKSSPPEFPRLTSFGTGTTDPHRHCRIRSFLDDRRFACPSSSSSPRWRRDAARGHGRPINNSAGRAVDEIRVKCAARSAYQSFSRGRYECRSYPGSHILVRGRVTADDHLPTYPQKQIRCSPSSPSLSWRLNEQRIIAQQQSIHGRK